MSFGMARGSGVLPPGELEFPCRYEIKAIGRDAIRFEALVQASVSRYVGPGDLLLVQSRTSRLGSYRSVTCVIHARSREQVDAIYAELGRRAEVLFAV